MHTSHKQVSNGAFHSRHHSVQYHLNNQITATLSPLSPTYVKIWITPRQYNALSVPKIGQRNRSHLPNMTTDFDVHLRLLIAFTFWSTDDDFFYYHPISTNVLFFYKILALNRIPDKVNSHERSKLLQLRCF